MGPRTRLAIATVYLAAMEVVLLLLQWLLRLAGALGAASTLSGWTTFLGWATFLLLLVLALRWLRDLQIRAADFFFQFPDELNVQRYFLLQGVARTEQCGQCRSFVVCRT